MKNLFQFLLISSLFLFISQSCSSDDSGGTTTPTVTSITLTANSTSVLVGDQVTFSVTTNTNATVTSSATISVDGNAISGSSFTPSQSGSYTVRAAYNGLNSNSVTINVSDPSFSSIVVTLSDTEVLVGESVTFTATGDTGVDLTNQVNFTVDGGTVSGNSYTPQTSGTYYVRARIGTINSAQVSFEASYPAASSIVVKPSRDYAIWGQEVSISVIDNYDQNVTNDAIIYVDGNVLTGNTITSDVDASFEIYATLDNLTSPTVTVNFAETLPSFVRNVLIEDFTGTWCQFCPRVSYAIELVEDETEHAFAVGLHGGGSDPYVRVNDGPLKSLIDFEGYPTGMINRITPWQFPESENLNQITSLAGTETDLGLSISTSLSNNTISAEVSVNYHEDISEDLELVVYLLEDGLLHDQINAYNNLYDGQNPIPDFEHNGVLSDLYTNILGDDMPDANAGQEYVVNYTEAVPSAIENTDNLYILAFVIEADSNICLNAQKVKVGESVEYEFL